MSHRRDDIDPEKIPTLTNVVIPGQARQPPLAGGDGQDQAAEAPPPRVDIDAELQALTDELAGGGAPEAPAPPAAEPTAGPQAPPEPAPAPERPELEALVEDILQRRLAGLREELVEALSRELARHTAERG